MTRTGGVWLAKGHTNFHAALRIEENIIGFNVTVDDVLAMQMTEPFACLWRKRIQTRAAQFPTQQVMRARI